MPWMNNQEQWISMTQNELQQCRTSFLILPGSVWLLCIILLHSRSYEQMQRKVPISPRMQYDVQRIAMNKNESTTIHGKWRHCFAIRGDATTFLNISEHSLCLHEIWRSLQQQQILAKPEQTTTNLNILGDFVPNPESLCFTAQIVAMWPGIDQHCVIMSI